MLNCQARNNYEIILYHTYLLLFAAVLLSHDQGGHLVLSLQDTTWHCF